MDTMIAAKCVHESVFMLRQIYLATLDLSIHGAYNGGEVPTSADALQALVDELRPAVTNIKNPPGANMLRNFGHLMNQYSAAYYGKSSVRTCSVM
jgi:Zn-dependent oligopeptidase